MTRNYEIAIQDDYNDDDIIIIVVLVFIVAVLTNQHIMLHYDTFNILMTQNSTVVFIFGISWKGMR